MLKDSKQKKDCANEHAGHRQRLFRRMERNELLEHEWLEALLFFVIPRRNTNDIAHRLLSRFHSIRGVMDESIQNLQTVEGVGLNTARYLYCLGRVFKISYELKGMNVPSRFERKSFLKYVQSEYGKEKKEVLDFYLLDKDGKIIHHERFSQADFSSVNIDPKEFTRMLVNYDPAGLVVVHNHPLGSSKPSLSDDRTTAQFQMIASFQNVLFCDHIIYGEDGVYSYYENKRMQEISQKYSISALTEMKE